MQAAEEASAPTSRQDTAAPQPEPSSGSDPAADGGDDEDDGDVLYERTMEQPIQASDAAAIQAAASADGSPARPDAGKAGAALVDTTAVVVQVCCATLMSTKQIQMTADKGAAVSGSTMMSG